MALTMPVLLSLVEAPRLQAQAPTGQSPATQSATVPQWQIDAGGKMAFDAASVKPHNPGDTSVGRGDLAQSGGHVPVIDVSLLQLMAQAFHLSSLSQAKNTIFGMPSWIASARFDIEAEAPGSPTIDQKCLMLQSLLADRFKLVVHHETRQMPIYALVLARAGKPGAQLRPHIGDASCDQRPYGGTGAQPPQTGPGGAVERSPAETAVLLLLQYPCDRAVGGVLAPNNHDQVWSGGRRVNMETIAASLGGDEPIDRPIIDRTGLSGTFDFTIEWDHQLQGLPAAPQPDQSGMSLFEALRDQLGLKLESTTGPVDVLVIDHVEQPLEN